MNLVMMTAMVWMQRPMMRDFWRTELHLHVSMLLNWLDAVLVKWYCLSSSLRGGTNLLRPLFLMHCVTKDSQAYRAAMGRQMRIAKPLNQSPYLWKYFFIMVVKGVSSLGGGEQTS